MRKEERMDLDEVKAFIAAQGPETEVMVGCDSSRFRKRLVKKGPREWFAAYAVVVVVHYDGKHGCKVFGDVRIDKDYGNIKQRLMQEVYYASETAYEILEAVGDRPFQIHLDLNASPTHKSNVALKEATGYIRGMFGIEPNIKPDASAASCAADRLAA